MLNLKLGQQRVQYDIIRVSGTWRVVRWIKYETEWEDETIISDSSDRRKAKHWIYRDLQSLRRSGISKVS